ncbi:hypothetical protein OAI33_15575 [Pirellulaceae bacterium]|nr:hypothetical protein [Pirellulaceae bacterium]
MKRRRFLGASAGVLATGSVVVGTTSKEAGNLSVPANDVYAMGQRRELFVDDFMVDVLEGELSYRLHSPQAEEMVIRQDKPWEGNASSYHTVFKDGDTYRMYYRGHNFDMSGGTLKFTHGECTCYAESTDGIHWEKPELGLFEFEGSKKNNIVWMGPGSHNFSPFVDQRPDCPEEERLKATGGLAHNGGMRLFKSADGKRWTPVGDEGVITVGAFDSANIAFWDKSLGKYRAYYRIFTGGTTTAKVWKPGGIRAIRTAVSDDLIHWEGFQDLTYGDSPPQQMYTNNVISYDRAPHILVGFPMRYVERGWSPTMKALPDLENRKLRSEASLRYGTALTETQIMTSRDGVTFKRWDEAFLRPGVERSDSWYYGHNNVAWNIALTSSRFENAEDELSFYAESGGWHGAGKILTRHSLRQDGFVSVHSTLKGGRLTTRPLTFSGSELELNLSTSALGYVKVECLTAEGTLIDSFAFEQADETYGDSLSRKVTWGGLSGLKKLSGKPIRLRFTLSDADLYSFKFV